MITDHTCENSCNIVFTPDGADITDSQGGGVLISSFFKVDFTSPVEFEGQYYVN